MKPLAVFYHCKLSGEGIPSPDFAESIMCSQMYALNQSGLSEAASEIHIGVNGDDCDAMTACSLAPSKSVVHAHGKQSRTEIPTQKILRSWLPGHEDWYVLYHHIKGVTHPGDVNYQRWRENMEKVCVWGWRDCISNLDSGFDAAGAHWLTPEKYPSTVNSPFFGGTFWWTTVRYLMQLPDLMEPTWQNRFDAEGWIGKRRPYPRVMDYLPCWPI